MKVVMISVLMLLTACDSQTPASSDFPPSASKTRDDVLTRIAEDFPDDQAAVLAMLDEYEGDTEQGRNRVQWVILDNSNRDMNRVRELVDLALIDYRDVLMYEYD